MLIKNIAILASGNGSNAENVIRYFRVNKAINVVLVITNNPQAGVVQRANKLNVPCKVINNTMMGDSIQLIALLENYKVDFIILAGFLKKIPDTVIQQYENKIINIHPSLLPKYGGKGMYGINVHKAVIKNLETISGITVHLVNENYDEGKILDQFKIDVKPGTDPEVLQREIQKLEKEHFPSSIERYIKSY